MKHLARVPRGNTDKKKDSNGAPEHGTAVSSKRTEKIRTAQQHNLCVRSFTTSQTGFRVFTGTAPTLRVLLSLMKHLARVPRGNTDKNKDSNGAPEHGTAVSSKRTEKIRTALQHNLCVRSSTTSPTGFRVFTGTAPTLRVLVSSMKHLARVPRGNTDKNKDSK